MTYGENSNLLGEALGTLLRQHRIQPRIGGPGTHTVPVTRTPAERAEIGLQIRRYRHGVLLWCQKAVTSACPGMPGASLGPRPRVNDLEHRLHEAIDRSPAGLPTMEELTTRQHFDLVDSWRQAARAAALGEHDFPVGVRAGELDTRQCLTVLADVADITRALVTLDTRCENIPGWQSVPLPSLTSAPRTTASILPEDHSGVLHLQARDRRRRRPHPRRGGACTTACRPGRAQAGPRTNVV